MAPRVKVELAEALRLAYGRVNRALKAEGMRDAGHPYARFNLSDLIVADLLVTQKTVIMSDVARALGSPLSTATTVVDRLVKAGMVERTRAENDRRNVQLKPTAEGLRLASLLKKQQLKSAAIMLSALTAEEQRTFLALFERTVVAAEQALLPNKGK